MCWIFRLWHDLKQNLQGQKFPFFLQSKKGVTVVRNVASKGLSPLSPLTPNLPTHTHTCKIHIYIYIYVYITNALVSIAELRKRLCEKRKRQNITGPNTCTSHKTEIMKARREEETLLQLPSSLPLFHIQSDFAEVCEHGVAQELAQRLVVVGIDHGRRAPEADRGLVLRQTDAHPAVLAEELCVVNAALQTRKMDPHTSKLKMTKQ